MTRTRLTLAALALALVALPATAAPEAYPFAVPPDRVFDRVAGLDVEGKRVGPLSAAERDLFADARDGALDQFSFADACLLTSGLTDPAARRTYLDQLDRLAADARAALAGVTTPAERADGLLRFLHAGPMAKGYRADQTDLHTVLDTGKFNCVSSAALYNVVGRRLGLDLRAVEVPGHVFAVLCDGDRRTDVETTTKAGFDPKPGGKAAKAGGQVEARERHAGRRREVGEAGLAAVIAYNHGVALAQAKKYAEAVLANARALGLDPANPGATRNALADLTNWPAELTRAGRYEAALAVLAVGRELVGGGPAAAGLRRNTVAAYDAWAQGHMKRGEWAVAIRVYERGLGAVPGDKHLAHNLSYCRQEQGRAAKAR